MDNRSKMLTCGQTARFWQTVRQAEGDLPDRSITIANLVTDCGLRRGVNMSEYNQGELDLSKKN